MNKSIRIVSAIFILALLVRLYGVDHNPPSLYWDEASIGYEAYSIAKTGLDMHGNTWFQAIFPAYGDYKAPVYIWLTSLVHQVLAPSILAVRLVSVMAGSLTVLVIYLLANQLFKNKTVAIYSTLALAILPWHIQFSRAGFEANLAVLFIGLFLLSLLKAFDKNHLSQFVLASVWSTIAIYSYFSARIVIPLMFIWLCIVYFPKVVPNRKNIIIFLVLVCLSLVPLYRSPHFEASNVIRLSTDNIVSDDTPILYANSLRAADDNTFISRFLHHRHLYTAKKFTQNFLSHFNPDFLFFKGDSNLRHSTQSSGVMLPIMIIPLLFAFKGFLTHKRAASILIGMWLIFLVPASVPSEVPHALRSLSTVIPLSLILGFGLYITSNSKIIHHQSWQKIFLGFLITANFISYYAYLQLVYPSNSHTHWQDGYPQLARYTTSQYDSYDYLVVSPGDRLFLYHLYFGVHDPHKFQAYQQFQLTTNPGAYAPNQIGKILLRPVVWADDKQGPSSTLLISTPDDFPPEIEIKDEIKDTQGNIQFVSVDLSKHSL